MKAADIVAAARELIDTPFRHQGRAPGVGLDCAGVFVLVCRAFGLPVEDEPAYGRNPYKGLLEKCVARQPFMTKVPKDEAREGDILLMRFDGEPQHIAIHAGETMIHSYEHVGRVVEHRISSMWRARIVHVYRFEGAL